MSLQNDAKGRHLSGAPADSFGQRTQAALYYFLMQGGELGRRGQSDGWRGEGSSGGFEGRLDQEIRCQILMRTSFSISRRGAHGGGQGH